MKKALYLASALTAFSGLGFAVPAMAQTKASPPVLTLGGYFGSYYKVQDRDNNTTQVDRATQAISTDAEIWFTGRTVLDNGVAIGVRVELEGTTEADQIDESYLTIDRADIGRAEFGSTDRAPSKIIVGAPTAIPGYGTIDPTGAIAVTLAPAGARTTGNFSKFTGADDAQGLNLYTASNRYFGSKAGKGIMLGFSYVPDGCEDFSGATGSAAAAVVGGSGRSCGGGFGSTANAGQVSRFYSVGANYVESFGPLDVAIFAGYSRFAIEANTTSGGATVFGQGGLEGYAFGTALTYNIGDGSAVQVGGLYKTEETGSRNPVSGQGGQDRNVYTLGARYLSDGVKPGSLGVGVDYALTKTDQGNNAGVVVSGQDKYTWVSAGVTYQLAPGVITFAGAGYYKYEDAVAPTTATNNDNKANFGILGMRLDF